MSLLLATQLLLQLFDLPLILLVPPLEALLVSRRQQWLGIGILGGLLPADLLGEQAPLAAITTKFRRSQTGGLLHHCELVGRAPTFGILLAGGAHLSLQPRGHSQLVEGDHMDSQLVGDLRHALSMGRPHQASDISLDGIAVRTDR